MPKMDILDCSRSDLLSWIDLRAQIPCPKIMVGAAIVRRGPSGAETLILKNKPGRDNDNLHEIPGGEMKDTDSTVRDAIFRTVAESVSLQVIDVWNCLPPIIEVQEETVENSSAKGKDTVENAAAGPSSQAEQAAQPVVIRRPVVHFNFVVIARGDGAGFQVNVEEHEMGIWVDTKNSADIDMKDAMRDVVKTAVRL
ncbi:MutT family protein [Colletotrichum scovillei]|uniref:MutT family protein n=1 Tax=Colletotrichum scovillei TaxID=1209932 RepID=A0A9P7RHM0_9PEZI|nr:MutT family protein [Colletotrichum scovillei]KAG7075662.1 MutT family protein [Colletotrichum scovillei]KAG7082778.1 MutT family protein [Colletotrichum scovillei]